MRPSRRSGKLWGWLAIAVILGLMWPVQMATFLNPVKMHYRTEVLPYFKSHGEVERFGGYIAGESATGAFMAGFRNIARTLLWIKVDELWHGGRWYRMLPVMVAITRVDPHFITVWETFGWHLAWNLNAAAKEGSIQAARDIESTARGLHEAMRQVSPELEKPLADDLADAQREVEIATRDLNEAYLDQQRLNEVLAGLRDALQHLAYAWERAAASIQDTSVLAPITQAQGNLLGSAERLAHQRAEERRWIDAGIDVDNAGIRANPDRYEMYWELAWLYFDRVKEYHKAERQLLLTLEKFPANPPKSESGGQHSESPFYVYHALAHCYEYQLEVDKAIAAWKRVQREVSDHPVPYVPKRSLWELETYGDDPVWGMVMIERERNVRKGRYLPPWNYTSKWGKAALAWGEQNKDDPEAVKRIEALEQELRKAPEETKPEETKPKRRFERDQPHDHTPAETTT